MATVYGDTIFGMTAESGMRAQSFDFDLTVDENFLPDEDGDDVAGALFNEKATFALNGFERAGGFTATLGASITLANAITADDYVAADLSVNTGTTICTGIKTGKQPRAHQSLDVSGIFKPFLGDVQV